MTSDAGAEPAPELPARGWLRLLADGLFGPFVFGRLLASSGVWIHNVAAALVAFELTRSAFVVGLVTIVQFLPQVVLAPWSGSIADRGDRRRQIVAGRLIVAAGSGVMAAWWWLGVESVGMTTVVLLVCSTVVGLGFVTGSPAMHAVVPSLVRKSEIATAVTINTAPVMLGRAAGPAVGAYIALNAGYGVAFLSAAFCNVAFAVILRRIAIPERRVPQGADTSIRAALEFLRLDRGSARILLGVAVVGFCADPAITLAPSISEGLGREVELTGALASAFGIGAAAGFPTIGLLSRWVSLEGRGTVGFVLTAAGLMGLVVSTNATAALAALCVAGVGMTLSLTSLSALLQQRLPDGMRGRVMALWSVGFLGSRPLAAAIDGALADLFSVAAALIFCSLVAVSAAWVTRGAVLHSA